MIVFFFQTDQMQKDAKGNLITLEKTSCTAFWRDESKIFCEPEALCYRGVDLPRINYAYNGKEYTYVYVNAISTELAESSAVSFTSFAAHVTTDHLVVLYAGFEIKREDSRNKRMVEAWIFSIGASVRGVSWVLCGR